MKMSKELEMIIANETDAIKSVEVKYYDRATVAGFVKHAKFIPLDVTLCKHQVPKGENPYHIIDFYKAICITIIYHNGTNKVFE